MNLFKTVTRCAIIKRIAIVLVCVILVVTVCMLYRMYMHGLIDIKTDIITQSNMEAIYLNADQLKEKGVLFELDAVLPGTNYRLYSYTDIKLIEPYGYDKSVYLIIPDKTISEYLDVDVLQCEGAYERTGILEAHDTGKRFGTCQSTFAIMSKYCAIYARFNNSSGTDMELREVLNNIIAYIE